MLATFARSSFWFVIKKNTRLNLIWKVINYFTEMKQVIALF